MKYNRFSIFKKLINKSCAIRIEISIKYAVLLGVLSLVSTGISLLSPFLYKLLIDNVMISGETNKLFPTISAMIGIFIAGVIISAISTFASVKFNNKINLATKTKVFKNLISKKIADILDPDVGNMQKLTEEDSSIISGFINGQIIGFFLSFLFAVTYFILMLIINPWLSLVSVLFIPIAILFGKFVGKNFNFFNNELWQIQSKNNTFLYDTIQKWREVKAQTLENQLTDEYIDKLKPELSVNFRWMRFYALKDLFYAFKNHFVQSLLLYFLGGLFIIWGQISIGALIMFMSYLSSLSSNVDSIINSITELKGNKAVFDRLFDVLDRLDDEKQNIQFENFDIDIHNVDFRYDKSLPLVLKNISFKFEQGKKYLIVGKSGEGKSTLIKLILCMIYPNVGEIRISGVAVDSIFQPCLFEKIGIVMQENQFFNLSIKENLHIIAPDATDEDIDNAIRIASLDDFIDSLTEKYDTIIGERGIKLSGGQKQRLAIARMILHKPDIAILDEATSSLDTITETKILSKLNVLFKNKTLIIISHKPTLQIDFDEKVMINEGVLTRVIE